MDEEQREALNWTKEQALAMFNASEPAKTRKRPRDLNKLEASVVGDATAGRGQPGIQIEVGSNSSFSDIHLSARGVVLTTAS